MRQGVVTTVVVLALLAAGCGGTETPAANDMLLVSTDTGSVKGVGIGDPPSEVERVFGQNGGGDGFFPVGARFTGPQAIPARDGRPSVFRYREFAFLASATEVYALMTTARDAVTEAEVGIGDDLDSVRRAYSDATCGEYDYGSSGRSYSWCRVPVGANTVFFGADPIESITIMRLNP